MRYLEAIDARDRLDGTPRLNRLRQVPEETGRFIAILAASTPEGKIIEIGTSAGYSTLWLSRACLATGRRLITYEILKEKAALASETFRQAGILDWVDLIVGDARGYINKLDQISFCFLDAEKDIYSDCYDLIIPKMVSGGVLAADNAINHREILEPMLERSLTDERVDATIVPVGSGVLLCRKI